MAYRFTKGFLTHCDYETHLPKPIELFSYPLPVRQFGKYYGVDRAYFNYEYLLLGAEGHPYFINAIKNDDALSEFSYKCPRPITIEEAYLCVRECLKYSLPLIISEREFEQPPMLCYVPRSFKEEYYFENQLGFKRAIRDVANNEMLHEVIDGTDCIKRIKNMLPSHRRTTGGGRYKVESGFGYPPLSPTVSYRTPNFMEQSCSVSSDVSGKDIILVDDIYTTGVGIDEQAIILLLEKGVKSVILYTIGRTRKGAYNAINPQRDIKIQLDEV